MSVIGLDKHLGLLSDITVKRVCLIQIKASGSARIIPVLVGSMKE